MYEEKIITFCLISNTSIIGITFPLICVMNVISVASCICVNISVVLF